MKRGNKILVRGQRLILALVVITAGLLFKPANGKTQNIALLLQQSPVQGGIITPDTGVYYFAPNTKLILTAVPKPGYQFLCWLGDVSDSTSNHTTVHLNAPKIIIAVFERVEYEHLFMAEGMLVGGSSGGGGNATGRVFTRRAAGQVLEGGGAGAEVAEVPEKTRKPEQEPIPEPATILLLGLGSVILCKQRY